MIKTTNNKILNAKMIYKETIKTIDEKINQCDIMTNEIESDTKQLEKQPKIQNQKLNAILLAKLELIELKETLTKKINELEKEFE